jgi:hypothetical protein
VLLIDLLEHAGLEGRAIAGGPTALASFTALAADVAAQVGGSAGCLLSAFSQVRQIRGLRSGEQWPGVAERSLPPPKALSSLTGR